MENIDRTDEGTEEQQDIEGNDEQQELQIEANILSIINKIKKDRNRACVQNIHTFINRRGVNIEVEEMRKIINDLILRDVIIDKGKQGKESFFVVELISEGEQIVNDEKKNTMKF